MSKTIFITGATGNMGKQTVKQLLERDKHKLKLLVLPSEKSKEEVIQFSTNKNVEIVYGDLTIYEDVLRGIENSDIVLHIGGLVSPMADYYPKLTTTVNVGAARNIVKAIKSQPNPDAIKLVYIGTVAQTGDRNPPIHWGRTGDPIKISVYDNYAISKTIAEREVIESGLKKWVSLRQSGILFSSILEKMDPIMFHQPLNGVLEWVTDVDSGRLMAEICEDTAPDDFWCKIYNIGGGEKFRKTNWQFIQSTMAALGIKDFKKVIEPNWFATQNFHGQWYEDSDKLEELFKFRRGDIDSFFKEIVVDIPISLQIAKYVPPSIMKNFVFKSTAKKNYGTLHWFEENNQNRITSFYGSTEAWKAIPGWDKFELKEPSKTPVKLNHGYDENNALSELTLVDMKSAAEFRGGKCVSNEMNKGDLTTKLEWSCAFDHSFVASPTLILLAGHWCPDCLPTPWNYDEEARRNPFFNQVWSPLHNPNENHVYTEAIFDENG